jgi:hypothetical protein
MTGEIVNLNKVRKARAKAAREQQAVENRAKFGRTKQERADKKANEALVDRRVDGHRLKAPPKPKLVRDDDGGTPS